MSIETVCAALMLDEGKRTNKSGRHILYKCPANKWTLGYGRNVEDRGVSDAEAVDWLHSDVRDAALDAAALFPSWLKLDEVRRDVLTNMSYNMGIKKLAGFHDLIAAVERQNWPAAKAAMVDSAWHSQVGDRAVRLERQMLTGIY